MCNALPSVAPAASVLLNAARLSWVAGLILCVLTQTGPGHAADTPPRSAAELMDVVMWQREPIGGPFQLTDHTGKHRRDSDFRGQLMLVYFGFTYCPNVCPIDLQQIGEAMRILGPAAAEVAALFITLDPERDTVNLLRQYAPAFHPQIVGLTGSVQAIWQTADAYKVYYAKVAVAGAARYTIDHSSFIYLMGRDGKYLGFMPPSTPAARIAAIIRPHLLTPRR
jgi:protein SCO2